MFSLSDFNHDFHYCIYHVHELFTTLSCSTGPVILEPHPIPPFLTSTVKSISILKGLCKATAHPPPPHRLLHPLVGLTRLARSSLAPDRQSDQNFYTALSFSHRQRICVVGSNWGQKQMSRSRSGHMRGQLHDIRTAA
jgi:hypothetical protein